jgi:hypothetical protein
MLVNATPNFSVIQYYVAKMQIVMPHSHLTFHYLTHPIFLKINIKKMCQKSK